MNMKAILAAFLLALIGASSSCSGSADQSNASRTGSGEDSGELIEFLDVLDRPVTIMGPVERVYYGFYYENLLAVAGPDVFTKVAATSLYDTEGYFLSLSRLYRENVPGYADMVDIGSTFQDNFNIERLAEMDLDAAILGKYQYDMLGDRVSVLEDAGIPVVVIDYTMGTMEMQVRSSEILGKIFGQEERAQKVIDEYEAAYEDIARRVAGVTDKKTLLIEWQNGLTSFREFGSATGDTGFDAEYIKRAAGDNIMTAATFEGDNETISPEYVLEADPEYVFMVGGEVSTQRSAALMGHNITEEEAKTSLEDLIPSRPGWDSLNATVNNHLYAMDNGIMRTMDDYTVVQFLGKTMYPELFEDVNPMVNKRNFYAKYMPNVPLNGTFFYHYNYEG